MRWTFSYNEAQADISRRSISVRADLPGELVLVGWYWTGVELDTAVVLLGCVAIGLEVCVVPWLVLSFDDVVGGWELISFCCFGVRGQERELFF